MRFFKAQLMMKKQLSVNPKPFSPDYVIALYIRLSIEDIKVESLSIENQKKVLHRYADTLDENGDMEILEFVDNGYSGTNFERPAIQELLTLVREGRVNCIIVKDFSRFGRNSIEVGYFMERVFPLYGIRFISVNDEFDSSQLPGDTGGLNVAFKYLVSEFYSHDLSIKSKSAKYVKMKRGEYQSVICPYGYQKGANGRMEPDPETAPNVQLIFEMAAQGRTINQIMETLFEKGIPTPGEYKASKGKCYHDVSRCHHIWQRSSVLRILADEQYTGMYIARRWEVTEVGGRHVRKREENEWFKIADHHPAIVSKEVFGQVKGQLKHFKSIKKQVKQYPLRGKIICGTCRHFMQRTATKNPAFICRYTRLNEDFSCHGLTILESELESLIYEILLKQAQIILNLDGLSSAGTLNIQTAEQEEYNRQIQNCQDKKRLLYERLLLKEIELEEYKDQKALIDRELNRLKQCCSALRMQMEQYKRNNESQTEQKELAEDISRANGLTAGLVDRLIDKVYIYPGNRVEIIWKVKNFYVEG